MILCNYFVRDVSDFSSIGYINPPSSLLSRLSFLFTLLQLSLMSLKFMDCECMCGLAFGTPKFTHSLLSYCKMYKWVLKEKRQQRTFSVLNKSRRSGGDADIKPASTRSLYCYTYCIMVSLRNRSAECSCKLFERLKGGEEITWSVVLVMGNQKKTEQDLCECW